VTVLVTGCAGFIGMHCTRRLLERGEEVLGIDNLSPYTSVELKRDRLKQLEGAKGFSYEQLDLTDAVALDGAFVRSKAAYVLHLAAQPGVRYALENPASYIQANLVGFANVLETCRRHPPQHLVYASSSSVYGSNAKLPWAETDNVDHPLSLYAATKKSNELMAHTYSHLFGLPTTGLRYFTVYGPWGRPDMSPILFARAIMEGNPIQVFNHGDMQRDFTYIDDVVEATLGVLGKPATPNPEFDAAVPDPASSSAPWRIYNVGNRRPVALLDYIGALENALGRKAAKEMRPMQPGDVQATCADTAAVQAIAGFAPSTPLEQGLERFADWFRRYYGFD